MPIGEIETHPYLTQGEMKGSIKLILGSFPVYECTDYDNQLKQSNRAREGTIRFFYGSVDSKLWGLYKKSIDDLIELSPNPSTILESLSKRKIAISDIIKSCERHEYSSEDSKLIRKNYNVNGLQNLIQSGVKKILCTSKGVLNDLEKQIICKRNLGIGKVNNEISLEFQSNFIKGLGGNHDQITNPISKVFIVNNKPIEALAIPSPGAPQRQLAKFGFDGNNWKIYSDKYFHNAFTWLNNDD